MKKTRVCVGLSGGVDSSAAALLLKEKGFIVTGLTMKLFDHQAEEIESAKKVCDSLGIDHIVLDLQDEFKSTVVEYLKTSYEIGLTPNPCVCCNKHFKYGILLDYCIENGIDYFATGHYAKVEFDSDKNIYRIYKSLDKRKDQTYNLYQLTQEKLKHLFFPLGEFSSKKEVREKSSEISSNISSKKDSTGICFINSSLYSFLKSKDSSSAKEGSFVDENGSFLGRHRGICNYTIGQKKNLPLVGKPKKDLAVLEIIASENKVVIGSEADLLKNRIYLKETNILDPYLTFPKEVDVKLSQWSPEYKGKLNKQSGDFYLDFKDPVRAPALGQSAVFYKGDELLGGGLISDSEFRY